MSSQPVTQLTACPQEHWAILVSRPGACRHFPTGPSSALLGTRSKPRGRSGSWATRSDRWLVCSQNTRVSISPQGPREQVTTPRGLEGTEPHPLVVWRPESQIGEWQGRRLPGSRGTLLPSRWPWALCRHHPDVRLSCRWLPHVCVLTCSSPGSSAVTPPQPHPGAGEVWEGSLLPEPREAWRQPPCTPPTSGPEAPSGSQTGP